MFHKNKNWVNVPFLPCSLLKSYRIGSIAHFDSFRMQNFSVFLKILEKLITMLIAGKIAKKIAFSRSRSLNFAIAIVLRSFDQMAIADRDLDRGKKIAITIDDQKIADHSCLADKPLASSILTMMSVIHTLLPYARDKTALLNRPPS